MPFISKFREAGHLCETHCKPRSGAAVGWWMDKYSTVWFREAGLIHPRFCGFYLITRQAGSLPSQYIYILVLWILWVYKYSFAELALIDVYKR